MTPLQVLYEDNHLLVVDKPAGIATMGTAAGVPTIARAAASYLKHKYQKPGNVFVGIVSRLDSLVSGVLVLARTSKAASRLSEQIRAKTVNKRYVAMVEGRLEVLDNGEPRGANQQWLQIDDWVVKDEAHHRMKLAPASMPGAQQASLRVRSLASNSALTIVEVDLLTGRKHQIRLQLSAAGHAILGDRKYAATRNFSPGIALHCWQLQILHPTRHEALTFTSLPGANWYRVAPKIVEKGLGRLNADYGSEDG